MTHVRDMVLGTAGHIDHGKTALVRALTGVDTDRLPAEKLRGITIDLGFASLVVGETRLAVIDVPGHERFIRNMLAGASGVDVAMLVVAADDSVMPQTREHLEILRLLGLDAGLVAVTKCDLVDPAWLGLVEDEVRALVQGTFLAGAPIVRTSAATGEGLDALRLELARVCAGAPARDDAGLFRMAIDRSFTVAGHGTVVTGTVASGQVAVGDELTLLPGNRPVRVRGLHRHDQAVDRVGRGARAAINLAGVHHAEVERGHELGATGYLLPASILSVELRSAPGAARTLRHRARYKLHLGTAEVAATLGLLGANMVMPGETCLGQLFLAAPVAAVHGQPFVIRAESPAETLGGGRILDPRARRIKRRDHAAVARLDALRSADPRVRIGAVLAARGLAATTETALCRLAGLPRDSVADVLAGLSAAGELVTLQVGPRRSVRVVAAFAAELDDRVLRALGRLHEARPRQSAIPRTHVVAELPDLAGDAVVAAVLDRLEARGLVTGDARTVAVRGFEPKLSQAERRLKAELAQTLHAGGFSPPDAAELAASAGTRSAVVPELLALLAAEQRIVEIGHGLYLDAESDLSLRRRVAERLLTGAPMAMAELRDLLGTTRKYAVPFGEYLDRIGVTLREGDLRRAGPAAVGQRGESGMTA